MLRAEKNNVVLDIREEEVNSYRAQGFDIVRIDEKGNSETLAYGAGKTVPYGQYISTKAELEKVKAELSAFKKLLEAEKEKPASKAKKKKQFEVDGMKYADKAKK